jgi:uncharacterized protein YcbX
MTMPPKQKTNDELFALLKSIFTVPQKDWAMRCVASRLLNLPQTARIRTCSFTGSLIAATATSAKVDTRKIIILLDFATWKDANEANASMKEAKNTLSQLFELPVEISVTSKESKPLK